MESRKIQRLEFVSHKIEGEDSKSEVICIRFAHPTTKNEFVWDSPWEAAMAGLKAPWGTGEGKQKGEKEGSSGARLGGGAWPGLEGCCSWAAPCVLSLCCGCCALLCVREKRRKKKGEEKEKKRKGRKKREKRKNMEKFLNLKISEK
jgi:hypothetical protein